MFCGNSQDVSNPIHITVGFQTPLLTQLNSFQLLCKQQLCRISLKKQLVVWVKKTLLRTY